MRKKKQNSASYNHLALDVHFGGFAETAGLLLAQRDVRIYQAGCDAAGTKVMSQDMKAAIQKCPIQILSR